MENRERVEGNGEQRRDRKGKAEKMGSADWELCMGTGRGSGHGGCPLLSLRRCACLSFRSAHFFRSAPSPLRLHRRSSLLTFSLLGLPSSFRFFRRLCPLLCFSISLPSFLPLFNCFPHSRSSPALSVRLSFRFLLAPLSALAGSHFWFLSFPVSSPSLSPSVFISSVLAQSSCLSFFLSLYLALSVLRFHTPPPFGRDGR